MKTIISTLTLATILAAPLAASAAPSASANQTSPTSATTTQTASTGMQAPTSKAKVAENDRQSVLRIEYESRQLGPTN